MKMLDFLKKYKKIFLYSFYILLFLIYILKPINFDTKIYLSAAYQADLIGGFPNNLFEAWEHKLILNRLIFYLLFKISNLFVSVNDIVIFEAVVKLIYGIISIAIIKLFSKYTKEFFLKHKINEEKVFFVLYTILIGTPIYFSLQTEITGILITLLAIVFVLKKKIKYKIIASLLISSLFFLKGVTLLYSVVILVVMILNKDTIKQIIFVIITSIMFLMLELLAIQLFLPQELEEIYLSTQYITNTWTGYSKIQYLLYNLIDYNCFLIGVLALIYNCICHIKTKNKKIFLLEVFVWIILLIGVYIQKMIYLYQIGLITPACILSIFICFYYKNKNIMKINKYIKMIIIDLILLMIVLIGVYDITNGIQIYSITLKNKQIVESLNEKYPDLRQEEVLYIGNGLSAYYIKAKSYTKYTTTIYLANNNEEYLNNEYIKELKEKIKNYKGKYIIIDDIEWKQKKRISDDVIKYISDNYHYLQSTDIMIYEQIKEDYSSIYIRNK